MPKESIRQSKINPLNELDKAQEIRKLMDYQIRFNNILDAYWLSRNLDNVLKNPENPKITNSKLLIDYKKIIALGRFFSLSLQEDKEVINLFQYHLREIINLPECDLGYRLRDKLITIPLLEDRDNLKRKLREAVLKNQQQLTQKTIKLQNGKAIPGTIANWLKLYVNQLGLEPVELLEFTKFFIKERNIQRLDEREKQQLELLYGLLEDLKLSSYTLKGFEEKIPIDDPGRLGILNRGIFEPLDTRDISPEEFGWAAKLRKEIIRRTQEGLPYDTNEILNNIGTLGGEKVKKIVKTEDEEVRPSRSIPRTQVMQEINKVAQELIKKYNLPANKIQAFTLAVKLFITDVRDEIETKEKFNASEYRGGLALPNDQIEAMLKVLRIKKVELGHKPQADLLKDVITPGIMTKFQKATKEVKPRITEIKKVTKREEIISLPKIESVKAFAKPLMVKTEKPAEPEVKVSPKVEPERVEIKARPKAPPMAPPVKPVIGIKPIEKVEIKPKAMRFFKPKAQPRVEPVSKELVAKPQPKPVSKVDYQYTDNEKVRRMLTQKLKQTPVPKFEPPKKKPVTPVKKEEPVVKGKKVPFLQRWFKRPKVRLGKTLMEDIKKPQAEDKIVGPIEELKQLDLKTWKLLPGSTKVKIARLKEEFNLLVAESYDRRAQGIKAWRQSPLYRLYVEIGRQSMEAGVSFEKIINQQQAKGQEILTVEEFQALADLNRSLRF